MALLQRLLCIVWVCGGAMSAAGLLTCQRHFVIKCFNTHDDHVILSDASFNITPVHQETRLLLDHCKIIVVKRSAFERFEHVTHLNLHSNSITHLDRSAFILAKKLVWVDLTNNLLAHVHPKVFAHLNHPISLQVTMNYLHLNSLQLEGHFEKLIVDRNNRDFAVCSMHCEPKTKSYNLTTLFSVKSVEQLTLNSNNLTRLPADIFKQYTMLTHINLEDNRIEYVNETVFSTNDKLDTLNLIGNKLKSLPQRLFANNKLLQYLDLSKNALESIDERLFESCPMLRMLRLDTNNLTTLHRNTFAGLKSLTFVDLSRNDLTTLPDGIFDSNPSLRGVRINSANFSDLPETIFYQNSDLRFLDMNRNAIVKMPNFLLMRSVDLQTVDLSHNKIEEVGEFTFYFNTKLKMINLSNNRLKEIHPNLLLKNVELQTLLLGYNRLEGEFTAANTVRNSTEIRMIDLQSNRLSALGRDLIELPNLRFLLASCNDISHLPMPSVADGHLRPSTATHLRLYMALNPFKCSCLEPYMSSDVTLDARFFRDGFYPTCLVERREDAACDSRRVGDILLTHWEEVLGSRVDVCNLYSKAVCVEQHSRWDLFMHHCIEVTHQHTDIVYGCEELGDDIQQWRLYNS